MAVRKSKRVLVLGELAVARLIAEDLLKMEFEPVVFVEQPEALALGPLCQNDPISKIRELLSWFYRQYGGQGWIHPGVCPWAERPELQTLSHQMGLEVMGPSERLVSLCSNKLNLLLKAETLGVPTLVLSDDPMHSVREIRSYLVNQVGTEPVWIRSARGSGHWSRFRLEPGFFSESSGSDDRLGCLVVWLEQLRANQGEVILFVEREIELCRRVRVHFVRYEDGRLDIFGISDLSLKCRNRQIVEFCYARWPHLNEQKQIHLATQTLASGYGFVGLGSFEFDLDGTRFFLVDAQSGLTAGYRLWEKICGVCPVHLQLVTQGIMPHSWVDFRFPVKEGDAQLELLESGSNVPLRRAINKSKIETNSKQKFAVGACIHILAEDLNHDPQIGQIESIQSIQAVQFDSQEDDSSCDLGLGLSHEIHFNYDLGQTVLSQSSGLLGLIFGFGATHAQVCQYLSKQMKGLWITGEVQTNERFIAELLKHPWMSGVRGVGAFHTRFIEEDFVIPIEPPEQYYRIAAWVCHSAAGRQVPRESLSKSSSVHSGGVFTGWKVGRRWQAVNEIEKVDIRWAGLDMSDSSSAQLGFGGWVHAEPAQLGLIRVSCTPLRGRWLVRVNEWFLVGVPTQERVGTPVVSRVSLFSQVSGTVHSLGYQSGQSVAKKAPLVLIAANGFLVPHSLSFEIVVSEWKVAPGDWVGVGQLLAILELHS